MMILKNLTILLALSASTVFAAEKEAVSRCDSNDECLKLAEVLYFEARGETKEGITAVGQVVLNRTARAGDTIVAVVDKKVTIKNKIICQFSYVCELLGGKPKQIKNDKLKVIAQGLLDNKYPDYAKGADHFFNTSIEAPSWSKNMTHVNSIGSHMFYDSTRETDS